MQGRAVLGLTLRALLAGRHVRGCARVGSSYAGPCGVWADANAMTRMQLAGRQILGDSLGEVVLGGEYTDGLSFWNGQDTSDTHSLFHDVFV
jgi:hypothetical protein